MKKTMLALAGAVMLASPVIARAQAADTRTTIAVLPFDISSTDPTFNGMGKGFQSFLLNAIGANQRVRVVERDEIQRILDEQKLGSTGQLDQATIVRVGKLLGAKYMIKGTYISVSPKEATFNIRAFNTETGEIIYTDASTKGPVDKVMDLIVQASNTASTKLNLPPLPAAGPQREAANTTIEKQKKMPVATAVLYAKALEARDSGKSTEATTLFNQVLNSFPGYGPAETELENLKKKK